MHQIWPISQKTLKFWVFLSQSYSTIIVFFLNNAVLEINYTPLDQIILQPNKTINFEKHVSYNKI